MCAYDVTALMLIELSHINVFFSHSRTHKTYNCSSAVHFSHWTFFSVGFSNSSVVFGRDFNWDKILLVLFYVVKVVLETILVFFCLNSNKPFFCSFKWENISIKGTWPIMVQWLYKLVFCPFLRASIGLLDNRRQLQWLNACNNFVLLYITRFASPDIFQLFFINGKRCMKNISLGSRSFVNARTETVMLWITVFCTFLFWIHFRSKFLCSRIFNLNFSKQNDFMFVGF